MQLHPLVQLKGHNANSDKLIYKFCLQEWNWKLQKRNKGVQRKAKNVGEQFSKIRQN